jgi:1,4-dihydroxy-2-naphthoate octaprenyltransferase
MNRTFSHLGSALLLAIALLAASALTAAAPHSPWAAAVSLILFVLAILGIDLFARRRSGRRFLPSPSALVLASAFVVAGGILAFSGLGKLGGMIPILGFCTALPLILRPQGAPTSCRRA